MSDVEVSPGDTPGTANPRRGFRQAVEALRHRNFALFWVGALLSNTGSWMQNLAVPYVVYQLTDSAVLLSVTTSFQFAPVFLMGPIGGSLADRFDRRTLLLASQAGQSMVAGLLWWAWVTDHRELGLIVGLVIVSSVINGLNIPAWQAFVSELVPRSALLNAVTLNSAQFNASRAFGPAVGGFVLTRYGAGTAFGINAVSYVAVIVALVLIRLPVRPPRAPRAGVSVWRAFVDSLHYSRARRGIMACFIVVTALGGLGSPFVQLMPPFAADVFMVDDTGYGWLAAGLGIGSILVAPVLAGRGSMVPRSVMVEVGMVAYGASMLIFAVTSIYAVGLVGLLIGGAGYLALASTLNTTIQLQVDETMRGKVLAVYVMLLTLALPVGLLVQAAVLQIVGLQVGVFIFGAAFVAVYAWMRLRTDYFARLDDEREERDELPTQPANA